MSVAQSALFGKMILVFGGVAGLFYISNAHAQSRSVLCDVETRTLMHANSLLTAAAALARRCRSFED